MLRKSTKYKYGLRKSDRLHHRSLVNDLFENGKAEYAYPLRMMYRSFSEEDAALQAAGKPVSPLHCMVNVPKKKQRKAVNRVLLRRRLRESYRMLRPRYADMLPQGTYLSVAFLYMSEKIAPYSKINARMQELFDKAMDALLHPEKIEEQEAKSEVETETPKT